MTVYLRMNHTPDFDGGPPYRQYGVYSTRELAEKADGGMHCASCATVVEIEVDAAMVDE